MDEMIVERRDYRFTTFQARELLLFAERAAFPDKMLQDEVFQTQLAFLLYAKEQQMNLSL